MLAVDAQVGARQITGVADPRAGQVAYAATRLPERQLDQPVGHLAYVNGLKAAGRQRHDGQSRGAREQAP
ncbi:hypothetical protein OG558_24410 [Kribbella sp. NBC_01510]|uniref:hypothetical protein n=1 Tax=Kribbella sp. NBC_01510 TaxID=2903581 RepID=UPI0038696666